VAGEKRQGRKGGDIGWHGAQEGKVSLSDRKLRVSKPRLRHWQEGTARLKKPADWLETHYPGAAAFLETEKNFRDIQGFRDLRLLKAKWENEVALDLRQAAV
jgi:hypothetical protein